MTSIDVVRHPPYILNCVVSDVGQCLLLGVKGFIYDVDVRLIPRTFRDAVARRNSLRGIRGKCRERLFSTSSDTRACRRGKPQGSYIGS